MLSENAYGMQAVQQALWDMFREVDRVCRAEGIAYSALGGTMLGAVREKGFIPWDDDVDLVLTKENLLRLQEALPRLSPAYRVSATDTWVWRVVRKDRALGGEFIDLFHYACVKQNPLAQKWRVLRLMTLQGMLKENVRYADYSPAQRLLLKATALLGKLFSKDWKLNRYRLVADDRRGVNEDLLFIPDECFGCLRLHYDAICARAFVDAPFEDGVIRLSAKADSMLRLQYGDYMTPPPQKERVSTHDAQRLKG